MNINLILARLLLLAVATAACSQASPQTSHLDTSPSFFQVNDYIDNAEQVYHLANMWAVSRSRAIDKAKTLAALKALKDQSRKLFQDRLDTVYLPCVALRVDLDRYVSALADALTSKSSGIQFMAISRPAYDAGRNKEACYLTAANAVKK